MIVTKDGLKYGAQSTEYTIDGKLDQDVSIYDSPYNWKIPYDDGVVDANFTSCRLDYEFTIQTEHGVVTCIGQDVPLELDQTYEDTINDGGGTASINITLTKNDNDKNFIITIQFNSVVASIEHVDLTTTIKYQYDPYHLLLKTVGEAEIHGNLDIRGDVSIGGSLTIPSDKGLKVEELTGSSIDIGAMTGGSININAITGGSLNCKVSEIGEAATSLEKGCLYYVPTQTLAPNYTTSGSILYYSGGSWKTQEPFHTYISGTNMKYYYLVVNESGLYVRAESPNGVDDTLVEYYKLPITITF